MDSMGVQAVMAADTTTAAEAWGPCADCGGTIYKGLTHFCSTSAVIPPSAVPNAATRGAKAPPKKASVAADTSPATPPLTLIPRGLSPEEQQRIAREARHAAATKWPEGDSWIRGYALDVAKLLEELAAAEEARSAWMMKWSHEVAARKAAEKNADTFLASANGYSAEVQRLERVVAATEDALRAAHELIREYVGGEIDPRYAAGNEKAYLDAREALTRVAAQ